MADENPGQSQPMEIAAVRLECLRLAHRPDRGPDDVLQLAEKYIDWVMKRADDKAPKQKRGAPS